MVANICVCLYCCNCRQEFAYLLMEILDEPVETVLKLVNKIRMKVNEIANDKGESLFVYPYYFQMRMYLVGGGGDSMEGRGLLIVLG